jgi:pimeloyl-ACP methyl ester carboxylesterase
MTAQPHTARPAAPSADSRTPHPCSASIGRGLRDAAAMRMRRRVAALLVAPAILCLAGTAVAAADSTPPRVSERMVPAGDVRLFVRAVGGRPAGPSLIMISGGPVPHGYMEALERLASPRLRVVTYDQRGVGRSTAPTRPAYSQAAYVRDLDAVRSALRIKRAHLLGHSWGGLIAQSYTAAHRDRVRSLTLVDSDPADGPAFAAGDRRLAKRIGRLIAAGKIPDPLPPVTGDDCSAVIAAIFPAFLANPDLVPPPGAVPTECRQSVGDHWSAALTPPVLVRVRAGLRRYRGPALIVAGIRDPYGAASTITPQRHVLAGARPRVARIPGAGHFPWLESPLFIPIIRRFLASHAST